MTILEKRPFYSRRADEADEWKDRYQSFYTGGWKGVTPSCQCGPENGTSLSYTYLYLAERQSRGEETVMASRLTTVIDEVSANTALFFDN